MGNLLTYSGITTKVRAMEGHVISPEDFHQIAQMGTTAEYISFLKKQPAYKSIFEHYDETSLHRIQIELLLKGALYLDYTKIYRFATGKQRYLLSFIFFRYEINILKICLQRIFSRNKAFDLSVFGPFFNRHSKLVLNDLIACQSIEEFISRLKGTEYYPLFSRMQTSGQQTLYDYEAQLDIYYFKKIWKGRASLKNKEEKKFITTVIGTQIELFNILCIYRSKKFYDLEHTMIYTSIIPCQYRLSREDTEKLAEAGSIDEFFKVLHETHYGNLFSDTNQDNMEYAARTIIDKLYRQSSQLYPSSMAPILCYLHLKEMELDHLTTALECIRYKLDPERTLAFVMGTNQGKRR